ncbi:MAG: GNAT family N-acetyltransferase [Actinomycetota bacterium]
MSKLFPGDTERLRFRRHDMDDAPFIHSLLSDPEHMRYYPRTYSLEEARGWIDWQLNLYRDHGFGLWVLELKETDELVGQCGLTIQDVEGVDEVEIGYHISKAYWRQGLATEAACACRDFAFDDLGLERIVITTGADNLPSQGVARKVGMSFAKDYIKVREGKDLAQVLFTLDRARDLG